VWFDRHIVRQAIPPATTIHEVVARLRTLQNELPPRDGVRFFNRLYLEVTAGVVDLLESNAFENPAFLERLDVFFGNAYFKALGDAASGPGQVSKAWAPLFEARYRRRVAPIQFALAGINAHINYDLPVGVVDTCEHLDLVPRDGTAEHRDFDRVNGLIAQTQEEAKRWLFSGLLSHLDRLLGRVDDAIAFWSVGRAREAAWVNAKALWDIRDDAQLTDDYLLVLGRTTGAIGRALAQPSVPGLQRLQPSFGRPSAGRA
jgi:Family of unknown function (DUF5995)